MNNYNPPPPPHVIRKNGQKDRLEDFAPEHRAEERERETD